LWFVHPSSSFPPSLIQQEQQQQISTISIVPGTLTFLFSFASNLAALAAFLASFSTTQYKHTLQKGPYTLSAF
jgi:hypothetical protein